VSPTRTQLAATLDRRLALLDKHARVRVQAWLRKLREEVRRGARGGGGDSSERARASLAAGTVW
jgi:hypothetical protein